MYILQEWKCGAWMNYPAAPFETMEALDVTATCIKRDCESIRLRVLVIRSPVEELAGHWSERQWAWVFAKRYHNLNVDKIDLTNRGERSR